jgi:uncharacterized protein
MGINKTYLLFLCILTGFLLTGTSGCGNDAGEEHVIETYDRQLAEALGADEYGMRTYIMAFLRTGPIRDHDPETAREIQRGHMENINRLAKEGKLILAGPFLDGGALRGIFLFNVGTVEEARALTETDPAIQAGRLEMELHPWYGSAALMKLPEIHLRIIRENP